MVWNQSHRIRTHPVATSDFVYLRLIGDRTIKEQDLNIQRDRKYEMEYWPYKFKDAEKNEHEVRVGIVAENNHYAGFGAATANMFRMIGGIAPVGWGTQELKDITELDDSIHERDGYHRTIQKTLLDYASK